MNLLITSAPTRALLRFVLVTLALMPGLIYGHGQYHGTGKKHANSLAKLAGGAHLVMETHSGERLVRPAREAQPQEVPTSAIPAAAAAAAAAAEAAGTVGGQSGSGGGGGGNKRVKNNNKKSNKSQNQMQHSAASVGGRKLGYKKSSITVGEEPLQQGHHHNNNNNNNNNKQQRQMLKQQQQQHEEHPHRSGKRSGAKSKTTEKIPSSCRYKKGAWTECDAQTNMRTRTLSLRKAGANCQPTRTIEKKCKKACRYEKGAWSECIAGKMTREDKLRVAAEDGSQQTCNPVRSTIKKCNPDKQAGGGGTRANKERKHKEKGTRRTSPQA